MVPVTGLVSMLICMSVRIGMRIGVRVEVRIRCGGILVELLQSSEDVGMSVRIGWRRW